MTQTALLDRIRATSHAITCQVSGELVEWRVKPSQKIGRWETLAIVQDGAGLVEVTSEQPGTIKALMLPIGSRIEAGAVVAYFQPEQAPKPRQEARRVDPSPVSPVNGKPAVAPHSAPQSEFKPHAPRRRGALPAAADLARVEVEELAIAPESAPIVPAPQKATQRSGKTKHATYHLEESQIAQIKRLALEMKLDDDAIGYSESEIVRAAVAMLLALPRPALSDVLAQNRKREVEHKYGAAGHPRPGNRRHKR